MGYVVVHEQVSVLDPETKNEKREERNHLFLSRGMSLPEGVSKREIDHLIENDAIAEDDSDDAQLAKGGVDRRDARSGPMQQVQTSESEQIRAAASAMQQPGGQGPQSTDEELRRLSAGHLAIVAKALGVPVGDNTTKDDLVAAIRGRSEDAESAEDRDALRAERDATQLAARESAGPAQSVAVLEDSAKPGGDTTGAEGAAEQASQKDESTRRQRRSARHASDESSGDDES